MKRILDRLNRGGIGMAQTSLSKALEASEAARVPLSRFKASGLGSSPITGHTDSLPMKRQLAIQSVVRPTCEV